MGRTGDHDVPTLFRSHLLFLPMHSHHALSRPLSHFSFRTGRKELSLTHTHVLNLQSKRKNAPQPTYIPSLLTARMSPAWPEYPAY